MSESEQRRRTGEAIDAYFRGLRSGDASRIPFVDDVVFKSVVIGEPVIGVNAVREFIGQFADSIESIEVERKVIDGDYACALFTWTTKSGIEIEICEHFVFEGRQIKYIRPYFDPRPILEN